MYVLASNWTWNYFRCTCTHTYTHTLSLIHSLICSFSPSYSLAPVAYCKKWFLSDGWSKHMKGSDGWFYNGSWFVSVQPPVAQTSKNFAEMRERLRRRLKQRVSMKPLLSVKHIQAFIWSLSKMIKVCFNNISRGANSSDPIKLF